MPIPLAPVSGRWRSTRHGVIWMASFMEAHMALYSVRIILFGINQHGECWQVVDMCTAITMQTVSRPGYWEYVYQSFLPTGIFPCQGRFWCVQISSRCNTNAEYIIPQSYSPRYVFRPQKPNHCTLIDLWLRDRNDNTNKLPSRATRQNNGPNQRIHWVSRWEGQVRHCWASQGSRSCHQGVCGAFARFEGCEEEGEGQAMIYLS